VIKVAFNVSKHQQNVWFALGKIEDLPHYVIAISDIMMWLIRRAAQVIIEYIFNIN